MPHLKHWLSDTNKYMHLGRHPRYIYLIMHRGNRNETNDTFLVTTSVLRRDESLLAMDDGRVAEYSPRPGQTLQSLICVHTHTSMYLCMCFDLCMRKQQRIRVHPSRTPKRLLARHVRKTRRSPSKQRPQKGREVRPPTCLRRRGLRPPTPSLCSLRSLHFPRPPSPNFPLPLPSERTLVRPSANGPFSSSDGVYIDLVPLASSHAISTFSRR